jgi:predicted RNA binding protein YcfA (HicA-like mRNA interferase family)
MRDGVSKKEKLLQKILNNPQDVRFEELDALLKHFGFECRRVRGDHFIYKRKGYRPLPIPRKKPVRSIYVKQALDLIEDLIKLND